MTHDRMRYRPVYYFTHYRTVNLNVQAKSNPTCNGQNQQDVVEASIERQYHSVVSPERSHFQILDTENSQGVS